MNSTQLQTTLMPIITFLAGLAAGKGLFGWSQEVWVTVLGGVVGVIGTVWAALKTTKTGLISQVASMPEVTSVKVDTSTQAGADLVKATPSNVTPN